MVNTFYGNHIWSEVLLIQAKDDMMFMEVRTTTKGDQLAGSEPISNITMVLNPKFSVQFIVSLLTLLIVKLGGDI